MERTFLVPATKPLDEFSVVARHNNLIEAQYFATLQEQRLFLWAVSQVQANASSAQVVTVSIAELARFVGLEKNANIYAQMMEITDRVSSRKIRIKNLENGEFVQSNLANARYRRGTGVVEIEISQFLLPYILKLQKNFTPVELKTVLRLGSFHAMRIYDFLKSRMFRGSGIEAGVAELYQILGVADKYQSRFNNFRQFVLEPACREINDGTDLDVSFVVLADKKNKRRAGSILFTVGKGGTAEPGGGGRDRAMAEPSPLVGRLVHAGLKPEEAARLVADFGASDPQRLTWHLDEMRRKVGCGALKNPVGWLRAGIRTDYRPAATPLERELGEKQQAREAARLAKQRVLQRAEKDEATQSKRIEARLATLVEALTAAEREQWIVAVSGRLQADVMRQAFLKKPNLLSPAYRKWVAAVALEKTGVDVSDTA